MTKLYKIPISRATLQEFIQRENANEDALDFEPLRIIGEPRIKLAEEILLKHKGSAKAYRLC